MECQCCSSTDMGIVETEVVCCNCGTIVANNNIYTCAYGALGNYEFRTQIKRVDKFELLLQDTDF